ncbi:MAG: hypothetical protein M1825_002837 [Sarcosagium campestre]|nr:MAG: hypothetical protein M1825_002837 [Sarcosagium campestre]
MAESEQDGAGAPHLASSANGSSHRTAVHPAPNPRSCVTCRRRKVKCDKRSPCHNCAKAHIPCIFPGPGRAPRRSKKAPDGELLARLQRLEGAVKELSGDGDEPDATTAGRSVDYQAIGNGDDPDVHRPLTNNLDRRIGRLVIDEGKSRYVSSAFWANLSEEVDDIKGILNETSDDEDDYPSPGALSSPSAHYTHQGFIFGFSSMVVSLRFLYPPPDQMSYLWHIFKENVDPMIKALHKPSTEEIVLEAMQNADSLSPSKAALLFSVFFCSITSLSDAECRKATGEGKSALHSKYRFATEQALARAGFMTTQELMILQAFLLFMICVRRHEETRLVWTLTGLGIRIALAMGLHRDGEEFGLPPFETEMRRRLWWHICVLDVRSAEDYGSDPTISEPHYDTKLPLNIDDGDFDPSATEPLVGRDRATDMTFCLVRFEIVNAMRRVSATPPGPGPCREHSAMNFSLAEKEQFIEERRVRLEEKYLRYCDLTVPLQWVAATVSRLMLAKLWLALHNPFNHDAAPLSTCTKDRLFLTSIEVLEYARLLECEPNTQKWGWFFKTYIQWHAVAFILAELCERTSGATVDRAWQAVNTVFDDWSAPSDTDSKHLFWRSLRRLKAKALRARDMDMARARCITNLDSSVSASSLSAQDVASSSLPPQDISASSLPLQDSSAAGATLPVDINMTASDGSSLVGDSPVAPSDLPPPRQIPAPQHRQHQQQHRQQHRQHQQQVLLAATDLEMLDGGEEVRETMTTTAAMAAMATTQQQQQQSGEQSGVSRSASTNNLDPNPDPDPTLIDDAGFNGWEGFLKDFQTETNDQGQDVVGGLPRNPLFDDIGSWW